MFRSLTGLFEKLTSQKIGLRLLFDPNCPMDERRSNSLVITLAICKCHTFSRLFVLVQSPPEAMHIICLHASFSICSYQIILYHRRQFDTQLTVIAVDEVL